MAIRLTRARDMDITRDVAERSHVRLLISGPVVQVSEDKRGRRVALVEVADWTVDPECRCGSPV